MAKARPLFRGHYQPRLPADLGFYDLRLAEVREQQAELARAHGINGFCYYHYWFGNGRRLLERPFNEVLASGSPDFPFCLCWANEPWSRRWLGEERDVLMPQQYSAEDDQLHADWLAEAFVDARYLKHEGRPLFLVYRPKDHPEPARLVGPSRGGASLRRIWSAWTPTRPGSISASSVSIPHCPSRPNWAGFRWPRLWANLALGVWDGTTKVYREDALRALHEARVPAHPHIPCVFVGWDNTPRRGDNAIILHGGGPASFGQNLRRQIER